MKFLINLVSKFTGIDAITKKLDGSNTKLAGVAAVLTGVAGIIVQWVGMPHDIASIMAFVQGIPTNPSWLTLVGGWAALGLGRKLEKASGSSDTKPSDQPK
jgi:hypothetical protein